MDDLGGIHMKDKSERKSISKADFLAELIRMDKDQINDMIKAKSKQPKLICPIILLGHENK